MWFYHRLKSPNHADGMANSVDPDQTATLWAVWSGSALFAQAYLSKNLDHYGNACLFVHVPKITHSAQTAGNPFCLWLPFLSHSYLSQSITKQTKSCVPSEGSDQPGHPPSLIRAFAVHTKDNKGPKVSSCGQGRLWSVWKDAQADMSLRLTQRSIWWFLSCSGSFCTTVHTKMNSLLFILEFYICHILLLFLRFILKINTIVPSLLGRSDVQSDCYSGGHRFDLPPGHISFIEIGHEIISTAILSLPPIQV